MKNFKKFLPLIVLIGLVPLIPGFASTANNFRSELRTLGDVFSLIQRDYVEDAQPKKLLGGALNGMLTSLDPYSQFLSKDAYEELKQDTHGSFGGIGVEVSMKGGFLRVIAPLDGSPAERAGIKPGDAIMKIDDLVTRDMTLNDAVKKMKGLPGTTVKLSLMHEEANTLSDAALIREVIKIKSVKEAKLTEEKIGVIRFSAFQENSAQDLALAVRSLESQGMRGLILDIRNNAGGLLTAAVEAAELFVPKDKLIVSTKGRNREKNKEYFSKPKEMFTVRPFAVLVNKGSASSSEILAGALQDYGIAVIIGSKTYGKGSIQSLVPLEDGSALRITTSRYYTPSGRVIHEKGIQPDILAEAAEEKAGSDAALERAVQWIKEEREKRALPA